MSRNQLKLASLHFCRKCCRAAWSCRNLALSPSPSPIVLSNYILYLTTPIGRKFKFDATRKKWLFKLEPKRHCFLLNVFSFFVIMIFRFPFGGKICIRQREHIFYCFSWPKSNNSSNTSLAVTTPNRFQIFRLKLSDTYFFCCKFHKFPFYPIETGESASA